MMSYETDRDAGVMEFTVDGEVTRAEYDAAAAEMEAVIAQHGTLDAVVVVRNFAGMELAAWWKDISWGTTHLTRIGRIALVTEIGWIIAASRATSWMLPGTQKTFTPEELEQARAWARSA